jgi:hypothetical protein
MILDFADELREAGGSPGEIIKDTSRHLPGLQEIASGVFGRWASMLSAT